MTFSRDAAYLATMSQKGTLIRIFDTQTGLMLSEFRRGSQPATVYSIAFNLDATHLLVTSSAGTGHIFSFPQKDYARESDAEKNQTSPLLFLQTIVPYFKSEWSMAKFIIPTGNSMSTFTNDGDVISLLSFIRSFIFYFLVLVFIKKKIDS